MWLWDFLSVAVQQNPCLGFRDRYEWTTERSSSPQRDRSSTSQRLFRRRSLSYCSAVVGLSRYHPSVCVFISSVLTFTDVSGHCWIVFGHARATVMHATRNGASPTTNYVTVEKSRQCHRSSTLVHWPSLTAVYCAYMKQMRLPSTGWQHMALSTR